MRVDCRDFEAAMGNVMQRQKMTLNAIRIAPPPLDRNGIDGE
jgi:hypothetical protein